MARAPKLNTEVAAVLTESAKNRDKRLQKSQNQLGTGIAGLVNLIADLIEASTSKKPFQQQGNLQRPPRPGTTRTFHVQAPPPPPPSRYYQEAPPPAPAPTRRQAPSTATRSRGGHQSRPYDKRHRR
ncbi:hypothetical protein ACJJTC_014826 [Scirpophaga incertulas]